VKTIEGLAPVADPDAPAFANDCSAIWHPSSKHFYIATATHDIIAVSSESWSKNAKFSDENLVGVSAFLITRARNSEEFDRK
jgi:chromosome transmission fidelity protein 4